MRGAPLTVFPDTWPISPDFDVRMFSDLRPGAFVTQLGEHRPARRSEERISIAPPLYEPFVEPPVLIVPRVLRPIGLMFALNGTITFALSKMAMKR